MKTAIYAALFLVIFQFSAQAQNKDSANLLADITGSERISLPESFVFDKSIDITFSTGSKAKPSILQYKFRSPQNQGYMSMTISGLSAENTSKNPEVVLDFETERIINFMCFSNTKMALIHPLTESKKDIRVLKTNFTGLKPTENSQLILGYNCTAYRFENESSKGTVWITTAIDAGLENLFSELGLSISIDETHTGYIMLMEGKENHSGEMSKVAVSQVSVNDAYAIDSQSYVATAVPAN